MKKLERDDTDYQHEYYESSEVDKCFADLEAQLAGAKQVANDCRIVADNAIAEAVAAKEDAARYQWLRDDSSSSYIGIYKDPHSNMRRYLFGSESDIAIDAAMQPKEQPND